jgi:hypothetical protein
MSDPRPSTTRSNNYSSAAKRLRRSIVVAHLLKPPDLGPQFLDVRGVVFDPTFTPVNHAALSRASSK